MVQIAFAKCLALIGLSPNSRDRTVFRNYFMSGTFYRFINVFNVFSVSILPYAELFACHGMLFPALVLKNMRNAKKICFVFFSLLFAMACILHVYEYRFSHFPDIELKK